MSIVIDKSLCVACGRCRTVCPGSLIAADENGKAYIKYPKDCWGCTSCVKECPKGAIAFSLGADIGGTGGRVHTQKRGDILSWILTKPDGKEIKIDVNTRESNKY